MIEWLVPSDPGGRALLDRWCAGVGPAIFHPAPLVPSGEVRAPIAIVAWNTHVGAADVVALVRELREGRLTNGAEISGFVLLLQEAFRSGSEVPPFAVSQPLPRGFAAAPPGFDVESIARALGTSLAYAPSMRNSTRPEDRGNAVLSSFPIGRVRVIEMPLERQRRAAIVATIAIHPGGSTADGAGRRLLVVNVHFDTAAGLGSGGPGATRFRQARALIGLLANEPAPIVAGGDLNTWWGDDEPAVKALREVFPDAQPVGARWTWRGPIGLTAKLDYLFARTGVPVPVKRLSDRFGSDHYPLLALVPAEAVR